MFFVVVVVAGDCKGDLGFCFYLGFGIYYFIMQIYYFNEQNKKIKVWDVGSIVKWDDIIDKIAF